VPLLLIGGVHCIQFINASYMTVVGRPQTLLKLTIMKPFLCFRRYISSKLERGGNCQPFRLVPFGFDTD